MRIIVRFPTHLVRNVIIVSFDIDAHMCVSVLESE